LPIAALIVHSLAMTTLAASGPELSPFGVLAGSLALLFGEMILAERWLHFRRL
jgi:hypothetical protein